MFFFSDNASPNAEDSGSAPAGDDSLIKDDNDQTSEPTDVSLLFKSICAVSTLQQDWDT
jgi:hypothetical protein